VKTNSDREKAGGKKGKRSKGLGKKTSGLTQHRKLLLRVDGTRRTQGPTNRQVKKLEEKKKDCIKIVGSS